MRCGYTVRKREKLCMSVVPPVQLENFANTPGMSITEILGTLATVQPDAPALHVSGRASLSYADLSAQARYVRSRLNGWGIERGDVVAGVVPSRPEMAVAWATVPSAGTFAPLNPARTADTYCDLLTRLQAKAVLVPDDLDHPVRAAADRCGIAEIVLAPDPSACAGLFTLELARERVSLDRQPASRAEWAILVTTSGTTSGRPKIVPISHRRIALHAQFQGEWLRLASNDVGCLMMPLHIGTGRISPLLRGVSFVCIHEHDIDGFFRALDEYGLTWLNAGPTFQRAILARAGEFRSTVARNRLRFITVTGARLDPDEVDRIEQTFGVPVLPFFGMTEANMVACNPLPPGIRKRGSVGKPHGNQVAIMSDTGAHCAAGSVGEVVIRGPLVCDGYYRDEEATAAVFSDGWFHTGDLGRFDAEGYLYLVGRIKDLISRGAEKISPFEIDAAITTIPGVRAAAAFGIPHPTLGEEIVAAVVRNGEVAITEAEILDHVRQRLGPKRLPRRIYFVAALPTTDIGKIRRAELARLVGLEEAQNPHIESTVASSAQMSPLASALIGLWSSVLDVGTVGLNDDFFLLGGDSLRGARLLANIETVFGIELALESLFGQAATVAGMAAAISSARAAKADARSG